MHEYPAGITSFKPMPYGYRRWNGAIWPAVQVDAYNRQLADIERLHYAGYDEACQSLIDGLYNLAAGFDAAGRL